MALILAITDAGRAALRNADASGTRAVRIASVGVSAAALAATVATATLPGEIKRITTVSGAAVAADIIHLTVSDETMATYTVRSFALYLDDGTLFAAYGQPDPIIEKSAQALMVLTVDVTLADIAASQIAFGDANFLMPPATVERRGLIELATEAEAAAGADRDRAVTPYTLRVTFADVWRASNDGSGSGLDADMVDGLHAAQLIADRGDVLGGNLDRATAHGFYRVLYAEYQESMLAWTTPSSTGTVQIAFGFLGGMRWRNRVNNDDAYWSSWNTSWHTGNDGAGSGMDADLLDGQQGSWYADIRARLGFTPVQQGGGAGQSSNAVKIGWSGTRLKATVDASDLGNIVFDSNIADVWRASNDGSGSGLDADMVDGLHAAQLIADRGDVLGGNLDRATANGFYRVVYADSQESMLAWTTPSSTGTVQIAFGFLGGMRWRNRVNNDDAYWSSWNTSWHTGNDGAGSGMDADLLDGQQGSWYADIRARLGFTPVQQGGGAGQSSNAVKIGWSGTRLKATVDASDLGNIVFDSNIADVWRASNDGSGSGLDADMVDGLHAAQLIADRGDVLGGNLDRATANGFYRVVYADSQESMLAWTTPSSTGTVQIAFGFLGGMRWRNRVNNDDAHWSSWNTNWHTGNDGAGSGMDADLLDGQDGSWYGNIPARLGYQPLRSSDIADVWRSINDGAGSGLDADLLDGRDGDWYRRWSNLLDPPGAFPPSGHTHGAADLAGAFPGSLAENGYTVLPNGLILQWVTGAGMAAGDETTQLVYFPIAFPNACFGALAGSRDDYFSTAADVMFSTVGAPGLDSVTVARKQFSERASDRVPSRTFVIAIGR